MIELFFNTCAACSRITTTNYSTSFSAAIKLIDKRLRQHIYNIYGFVRFADEIVDTLHTYDKTRLLDAFSTETYTAIEQGISLNPILNSFQYTVNTFEIDTGLIDSFFKSMRYDLYITQYDEKLFEEYVYGSAESVGLMCLYVFCEGNKAQFEALKPSAQKLGAAFQKVNFLRDIRNDYQQLSRTYFPGCDFSAFNEKQKQEIELSIEKDFKDALQGIMQLPDKVRPGVYIAYKYYLALFKKIKKTKPEKILQNRIRIPNHGKLLLLLQARVSKQLRLL